MCEGSASGRPHLGGSGFASQKARAWGRNVVTGQHTLGRAENAVAERLGGTPLDYAAMAAVSSIYRAASAVRNHLEREILAPHGLTWTGWVVLLVIWVWESVESRHVAAEAGISKSTLTGVVTTLEKHRLVRRNHHPADGRRVVLTLTSRGEELLGTLLPKVNEREVSAVASLAESARDGMSAALRQIVLSLEPATLDPPVVATPTRPTVH